jgi:tRNA G46 methylase TrmB
VSSHSANSARTPRSRHAARLGDYPGVLFTESARVRWREHFAERVPAWDNRIVLEIGCFDAAFLARIAERHPMTAFIGMDWKVKPLVDAAAGVTLTNVALLHGRAQRLGDLFVPRDLDDVWLFHPDPCDRAVELPNRLFQSEWLRALHPFLRSPGESTLMLKTDHPGYYQHACALLGLPTPGWFMNRTGAPKTRWRDVVDASLLLARDDAIPFDVTLQSHDFWNDAKAQQHISGRPFAGEQTLFEERFVTRREPIYAIELRAR